MANKSKKILLSTITTFVLIIVLQGCNFNNDKKPDRSIEARLASYSMVSNKLTPLSDDQLTELLSTATKIPSGWGTNASLIVDGIPVFVKKVPLTDFEMLPKNVRSTANIFNMPLFFQYGVASLGLGFSVWRELEATLISSNWVLNKECENFPLLYHWRVLLGSVVDMEAETFMHMESVDKFVGIHNNSPAIRARVQFLNHSPAYLALFFENIPETLDAWLDKQFKENDAVIDAAVTMVEKDLEKITSFLQAHGMYHFDPKFDNILTDGQRLYLTDFGRAASLSFDLSPEERAFLKSLKLYDRLYVGADLALGIARRLTSSFPEAVKMVKEYAKGKQEITKSSTITDMLKKYSSFEIAKKSIFDDQFSWTSKFTPLPAEELEKLIATQKK